MIDVLFFTWNLHKNKDSLRLALSYLKKQSHYIAVLQEVPLDAKIERCFNQNILEINQSMVFLCSEGIAKTDSFIFVNGSLSQESDCLIGVRVCGSSWTNLLVVGAHMVDKRTLSETEYRFPVFATLAENLHQQWRDGEEMVLLGDMNANPFDHCICSYKGFWAVRNTDELTLLMPTNQIVLTNTTNNTTRRIIINQKRQPIYNPMWQFLPEQGGLNKGTYRYRANVDFTGLLWHWFDQILISKGLVDKYNNFEIVTVLDGIPLIIRRGADNTQFTGYGDHLPVKTMVKL